MKVERREGGVERRVVIGMVTCDSFLARIASRWEKEGMLRSAWANLIGQWCIDYHAKHKKAPGRNIQAIYEIWAEESTDKDSVEGIGSLLSSISSEYAKLKKEANPDHLADMAAQHFDRVNAERRLEKAQQWLDAGHTDRAIEAMNGTKKIQLGSTQWVDPYGDVEAMRRAFERKSEPLIKLQGDIGEFFGDSLERDGFVAIQGQSKRKKSWALQELGHQALLQGRKVAMFQVGDLSEGQIMMRLMVRAAKRPRREGKARIPTVMRKLRDGIRVEHREVEWDKPLTLDRAQKAMSKVKGKEEVPRYRLEVHPNTSISVAGIMERMAEWDAEGWSADVVVIDYADILAPVVSREDKRDSINTTWQWLRRLSQERHCLVLTATQADAASFDTDLQTRRNFSNDRRKLDHVTAMYALNMTDKELGEQRMRINCLELREGEFTETRVVHAAGCLAIANPWVVSCHG